MFVMSWVGDDKVVTRTEYQEVDDAFKAADRQILKMRDTNQPGIVGVFQEGGDFPKVLKIDRVSTEAK